jgi:hypothetical protein
MFCTNCGEAIADGSIVCPACHFDLTAGQAVVYASQTNIEAIIAGDNRTTVAGNNRYSTTPQVNDEPSTGLNVLSFLLPIVGFIAYGVSHLQTPLRAKAALNWALIGTAIGIIVWILIFAASEF